jgi:predicted porin
MTIPGVGAAGGMAGANPANTSLGSIGLGYIYADTLAQMNYTTPDFSGFKLTVGIYDALEPIGASAPSGADAAPGFHAKATWTNGTVYLSSAGLYQKNNFSDADGTGNTDFKTRAIDFGGKVTLGAFEVLGWYYTGKGIGTTALLLLPVDPATNNERKSDGFLAQATYKIGDTKLGVNYGESNLHKASGEADSSLVKKNSKVTVGAYHSLTKNLTLLAEFTDGKSKAHDGDEIKSSSFNVGAFLSF